MTRMKKARRGSKIRSGSRMSARRGMRMSKSKKSTMSAPKKTVKKAKKKGKKKLNAYMLALKKARDTNAPNFTYNGKTYYQKKTKTGMIIYSGKK